MDQFTVDVLGGFAGLALNLGITFIPGWREQYAGATPVKKAGIMALLLLGVTLLVVGSSCANLWVLLACTKEGFMAAAGVFFSALVVLVKKSLLLKARLAKSLAKQVILALAKPLAQPQVEKNP